MAFTYKVGGASLAPQTSQVKVIDKTPDTGVARNMLTCRQTSSRYRSLPFVLPPSRSYRTRRFLSWPLHLPWLQRRELLCDPPRVPSGHPSCFAQISSARRRPTHGQLLNCCRPDDEELTISCRLDCVELTILLTALSNLSPACRTTASPRAPASLPLGSTSPRSFAEAL